EGPASALEKDPQTGEWKVKLGNYFPKVDKEDASVSYLTWDGKLDSAFKELELIINQLYILGETSPALLGDDSKGGQASSGTALRLRMISPLAKAKRIKNRMDPKLKKAFTLASELGDTTIKNEDISIVWADGLPNDPKEDAEIMAIRTGQKPTMSISRALKQFDGMSNRSIQEEKDLILEDDSSEPTNTPNFDDTQFNQDPTKTDPNQDPNKNIDPNKEA
ncbi:MAG TPA: phage portal protein, partial [Spirochaetota bacterium]|nr:phage portal protein [Spirochaetota bacterium]